jgi:hypothetical protein
MKVVVADAKIMYETNNEVVRACEIDKNGQVSHFQKEGEAVNHPSHYGGQDNTYEAIKVIEAWILGFNLGNSIKYIARAGKKSKEKELEDLEKAAWYLNREIEKLKEGIAKLKELQRK